MFRRSTDILQSTRGASSRSQNVTKNTTYDEFDKERHEITSNFCQDKLKAIETLKKPHQLTLDFFHEAVTECDEKNRREFILKKLSNCIFLFNVL